MIFFVQPFKIIKNKNPLNSNQEKNDEQDKDGHP